VSVPIEADIDAMIGARLAEVRRHCSLTQGQLAKAVGVTLTTIQNWQRGRTGLPAKRLAALANALHCQPIDLLICRERACRETYPHASAAVAGGAAYRRGFAARTYRGLRAALSS
jgi:transcriptional regulator with XRE-family HTH domain